MVEAEDEGGPAPGSRMTENRHSGGFSGLSTSREHSLAMSVARRSASPSGYPVRSNQVTSGS